MLLRLLMSRVQGMKTPMRKKIITSGVDSEYVIGPLAQYLRDNGWDVFEMDFGTFNVDPHALLEQLAGEDLAYITSAHTNVTRQFADAMAPTFLQYPNYLSPLEIFELFKPKISFYIPHDLLTPYGDVNLNEYRFLDLFDYVLSPFSAAPLQATLGAKTKVIQAGWIRHAGRTPLLNSSKASDEAEPKVALFVTMIDYLRTCHGDQGVVDYFKPLLGKNVRIKLPAWHGIERIEKLLDEAFPGCVVSAQTSSIDLISDADIVVCNGVSSIHVEAGLMGRPAVCLLDNEAMTMDYQRAKLSHLPHVYFHDYSRKEKMDTAWLDSIRALNCGAPANPFDFKLVEELLFAGTESKIGQKKS